MKKALIDKLLLAGLLYSAVIMFIATVGDEKDAKRKVNNLLFLTDSAVESAGNYYLLKDRDMQNSEDFSDEILDKTKLGTEAKPLTTYTWDTSNLPTEPIELTATITNYQQDNFWYRLLDLNFFNLSVSSTGIVDNGDTGTFVPIIVNGCTREFENDDTLEYILKAQDLYDDDDNVGFYGAYDPSGGQSSFSHLKNEIGDLMNGIINTYNFDSQLNVSTVDSSNIQNDVKQIAQKFDISSFSPTPMTIAVAECGSTAANLLIDEVLEITLDGVYCGTGCTGNSSDCQLTNLNGAIFNAMSWGTSVNACNSADFFKIEFTVNHVREIGTSIIIKE